MIRKLVDFALNNRYVVLAVGLLLLGWGAVSFHNMPVEAYPSSANGLGIPPKKWNSKYRFLSKSRCLGFRTSRRFGRNRFLVFPL
jgi:hypothetical protein